MPQTQVIAHSTLLLIGPTLSSLHQAIHISDNRDCHASSIRAISSSIQQLSSGGNREDPFIPSAVMQLHLKFSASDES